MGSFWCSQANNLTKCLAVLPALTIQDKIEHVSKGVHNRGQARAIKVHLLYRVAVITHVVHLSCTLIDRKVSTVVYKVEGMHT